ncbi:MAG: glycosyltransferase family 39 protein [Stappiaceae bacterium]
MRQVQSLPGESSDLPVFLRPQTLIVIVLGLTVIRLITAATTGLVEDEAYYRLWGLNPAFGYYDHPPMIGWWIAIGQFIAGDNALGVRLVGVLATFFGSFVLWRTSFLLFDRQTAGLAVLFFNSTILIGIGSILATPDAPSVFFWGMSLWALAELNASKNGLWWLVVGFFAGCGLLSKYSVLFLGVGIILWVLWVPELRRWILSWQMWVGGLVAGLLVVPLVLWNMDHEWASFVKQFGRAVPKRWTLKYLGEFAGAMAGLVNPLMLVFLIPGIGTAIRRTFSDRAPGAALLVLTSMPFLLYLMFHAFHGRVQANWPAPLFPALSLLAAPMAAGFGNWAMEPGRWTLFWRKAVIVTGVLASLIVYVHAITPLTGAMGRKEPTFQLRGWNEIGAQIAELAQETEAQWVATSSYGLTGELDFVLRGQLPVVQLTERIRFVMAPKPDREITNKPGLYVAFARKDSSGRAKMHFRQFQRIATLKRTVKGTILDEINVYYFSQPLEYPLDPAFPLPDS